MRRWKLRLSVGQTLVIWFGVCLLLAWQRKNVASYCYRMIGIPAVRLVENQDDFPVLIKQERAALFIGPDWAFTSQFAEAKFIEIAERSRAGWSAIRFFEIDYTGIPRDLGFYPWIWEQELTSHRWRHGYGTVSLISDGEVKKTIDELELLSQSDAQSFLDAFRGNFDARTKKPH